MYTIQLPNFHGPFDLLLYFIKRDELNIHDIPIAQITQEFLEYTRLIEILDLELAGEFLVMASSLVQIKAKFLLPEEKNENGEEQTEEEDPRAELVRRLLEYKRYKEAAEELRSLSEAQRYLYYRQFFEADVKNDPNPMDELAHLTLFDLLAAFSRALKKAPKAPEPHRIEREPVTIEEQSALIMALLRYRDEIPFSELIEGAERSAIVVTFLALLEMMRNRHLKVTQHEQFGEIVLCKISPDDERGNNAEPVETDTPAGDARASSEYIGNLKELKRYERIRKPPASTSPSAGEPLPFAEAFEQTLNINENLN